ncbi:hypothetical protein HDU81_007026 [Chytriomyces hyalinus]|nr:hypothetical protein HDU81_007026 [Chytriomyces hyalinus]
MSTGDLTLRKRLEVELAEELYECNICIDVVFVADAVFACDTCHAVSHLRCVDEWATTQSEQWRCPSCPRLHLDIPEGACYCGKALGSVEDPSYLIQLWIDVRSGFIVWSRMRGRLSCRPMFTMPSVGNLHLRLWRIRSDTRLF